MQNVQDQLLDVRIEAITTMCASVEKLREIASGLIGDDREKVAQEIYDDIIIVLLKSINLLTNDLSNV